MSNRYHSIAEKIEDWFYWYLVKLGVLMKNRRDQRAALRRESSDPRVANYQKLMDATRQAFDREYDRQTGRDI